MRREINGKQDNMTKEMQSLAGRMEEAEVWVQQVEDCALTANEALCKYMEEKKILQQRLTEMESRSQRNPYLWGTGGGGGRLCAAIREIIISS